MAAINYGAGLHRQESENTIRKSSEWSTTGARGRKIFAEKNLLAHSCNLIPIVCTVKAISLNDAHFGSCMSGTERNLADEVPAKGGRTHQSKPGAQRRSLLSFRCLRAADRARKVRSRS